MPNTIRKADFVASIKKTAKDFADFGARLRAADLLPESLRSAQLVSIAESIENRADNLMKQAELLESAQLEE